MRFLNSRVIKIHFVPLSYPSDQTIMLNFLFQEEVSLPDSMSVIQRFVDNHGGTSYLRQLNGEINIFIFLEISKYTVNVKWQ